MKARGEDYWRVKAMPCMWPVHDRITREARFCRGRPVKVIEGYVACASHAAKYRRANERKEKKT